MIGGVAGIAASGSELVAAMVGGPVALYWTAAREEKRQLVAGKCGPDYRDYLRNRSIPAAPDDLSAGQLVRYACDTIAFF